jgi:hypothetical protein
VDKVAKLILNQIKCPICKSPVDLLDWKVRSETRKYNFCCAADWQHYRFYFIHWEPVYRVEYENLIVFEGNHEYVITQFDNGGTEILIFEVDAENNIIESKDKKPTKFSYNKKLFDFSQTTREKIINRVKTILVFQ